MAKILFFQRGVRLRCDKMQKLIEAPDLIIISKNNIIDFNKNNLSGGFSQAEIVLKNHIKCHPETPMILIDVLYQDNMFIHHNGNTNIFSFLRIDEATIRSLLYNSRDIYHALQFDKLQKVFEIHLHNCEISHSYIDALHLLLLQKFYLQGKNIVTLNIDHSVIKGDLVHIVEANFNLFNAEKNGYISLMHNDVNHSNLLETLDVIIFNYTFLQKITASHDHPIQLDISRFLKWSDALKSYNNNLKLTLGNFKIPHELQKYYQLITILNNTNDDDVYQFIMLQHIAHYADNQLLKFAYINSNTSKIDFVNIKKCSSYSILPPLDTALKNMYSEEQTQSLMTKYNKILNSQKKYVKFLPHLDSMVQLPGVVNKYLLINKHIPSPIGYIQNLRIDLGEEILKPSYFVLDLFNNPKNFIAFITPLFTLLMQELPLDLVKIVVAYYCSDLIEQEHWDIINELYHNIYSPQELNEGCNEKAIIADNDDLQEE